MPLQSIGVIGAGPAGITAAINAAREAKANQKRIRVILFEAENKIGKKILVTGNGRCNLSNQTVSAENYFGAVKLFEKVYKQFDRSSTLRFFNDLGLATTTDAAGRDYPRSLKAASVVDALLYGCECSGVDIKPGCKVESIVPQGGFLVVNNSINLNAIILSTGGAIDPRCKQTNSSFGLIKNWDLRVTPIQPALTAFYTKKPMKHAKGVRATGRLTLLVGSDIIAQTSGEIQYTDYGLSGIPAMQLSSYYARLDNRKDVCVIVDSIPEMDYASLRNRFISLKKKSPDMPIGLFCSGLVPKQLGEAFLREESIDTAVPIDEIDNKTLSLLLSSFKQKKYVVSGLHGYENAQVTSGGIRECEITDTLMLRKFPGVFVCGEIVDINGDCGGYNLQWAWSSGAVSGKNCIRRIL